MIGRVGPCRYRRQARKTIAVFAELALDVAMPAYRSGMKDDDFSKPIIAMVNSFTQFVPGHVHLKDLGQLVAREIEARRRRQRSSTPSPWTTASPWATTACSIRCPAATSLPTASSTWSTPTAPTPWSASPTATRSPRHADGAMRLNIPVVFVSGGPMEAGKVQAGRARAPPKNDEFKKLDLIDAMVMAADDRVSDADVPRSSVRPAPPAAPARACSPPTR